MYFINQIKIVIVIIILPASIKPAG